jgi:flagellar hook-associated protein 3 FlgL
MIRVATTNNFNSVTSSIMQKMVDQVTAQNQVLTGKLASDLSGYSGKAETLAATTTMRAQSVSAISVMEDLSRKLDAQNLAMEKIGDASKTAKQAILDAIGGGSGQVLMTQLQAQFGSMVDGLNFQHEGKYLFAGTKVDTKPIAITDMAALGAGPVASVFLNDDLAETSQIDGPPAMKTGVLADGLGSKLMAAFKNIQDYFNANGDFSNPLTTTQESFLRIQVSVFDDAQRDIVNQTAINGAINASLDASLTAQNNRRDWLDGVIGQVSDVNAADAISRLKQAQNAIEGATQVFNALKASSLLNFLR